MDVEIRFREQCYQIQGAVFDVYREMGSGFLEAAYQECLEKELSKREIPFVAHQELKLCYQELKLCYKGEMLQQTYIPDFVCHDAIIVELKALSATTGAHKAQVLNYLKATGMRLGLLVNFGCHPKATVERIVL
jgi:GxxExxY protein